MDGHKVKVAINGYGVIGKRIADAVALQDDMEVLGVSDVVTDWRIKMALEKGYRVFAATQEAGRQMVEKGIPISGDLNDLLSQIDIVIDATPKKIASSNFSTYQQFGVKAIFQGGEKHSLTGHSFVAQANYASAIGLNSTRVVSCNTTSIVRVMGALVKADLFKKARGVLIRRAADPVESDNSGVMNTIVPETHIPSHQGPDAQAVLPGLDVVTIAVIAAHTTSHLHSWSVELTRVVSKDEILAAFRTAPRIAFLQAGEGVVALNHTLELMTDLGRPRGDMWEVGLWEDSLAVYGKEVFFNYQVYNQAIVIPENIDAIRALMNLKREGDQSIAKTDMALGMRREFLLVEPQMGRSAVAGG